MAAAARPLTDRFPWLDDWTLPFKWIVLTPLVTLPVSAALFEGFVIRSPAEAGLPVREPGCEWWCSDYRYGEVTPTVLAFAVPGLINLLPVVVWGHSTKPRVRQAATIAGLLGLLRLSAPLILMGFVFDTHSSIDLKTYFALPAGAFGGPPAPYAELWSLGFVAWLVSLVAWWIFGRATHSR